MPSDCVIFEVMLRLGHLQTKAAITTIVLHASEGSLMGITVPGLPACRQSTAVAMHGATVTCINNIRLATSVCILVLHEQHEPERKKRQGQSLSQGVTQMVHARTACCSGTSARVQWAHKQAASLFPNLRALCSRVHAYPTTSRDSWLGLIGGGGRGRQR